MILNSLKQIKISWIIGIILFIGIVIQHMYYKNKVDVLTEQLDLEKKLVNALNDSVIYYNNIYGDVVAEKLSLQYDLDKLTNRLDSTKTQNGLLIRRINNLEYRVNIISAALIQSETTIDSLLNTEPIIYDDKIVFKDSTENLKYLFEINNVMPIDSIKSPSLHINHFSLPNQQFIDFHWRDDKKEGFPVAFSVTNTNPYIKTTDISSYIIPEISKTELKPSTWDKIGKFLNSNGLIAVGATTVIFGTLYILK